MKRRSFIQKSSLTAFSISITGSIFWNGKKYVGTDPTTSDILGPFYRPNSPTRSNIIPPGSTSELMNLSGLVFKEDGKTPLSNAMIEIWQCDENQHYDNFSDEYLCRGKQITGKDGKYTFRTIMPVPYKADPDLESSWRPAHIHLRISSESHQDLITQIYFSGDKYIDTDSSASSPQSKKRILDMLMETNNEKSVRFDIVMGKSVMLDDTAYKKIEGLYQTDNKIIDSTQIFEFKKEGDLLMMKLKGQIAEALSYIGNNTFEGGLGYPKVKFDLLENGGAKVTIIQESEKMEATKFLKY